MLFGGRAQGLVGCYRGSDREGWPQGRWRRGERDGGLRVHLPLRDQRDRDGRSACGCWPGELPMSYDATLRVRAASSAAC